jgi:hypothetical protein
MTNFPGSSSDKTEELNRLKQAFLIYSTNIKRKNIIKKSSDDSLSDVDRFKELKKLFDVPQHKDDDITSVYDEDMIMRAIEQSRKTEKILKIGCTKRLKEEYTRYCNDLFHCLSALLYSYLSFFYNYFLLLISFWIVCIFHMEDRLFHPHIIIPFK